MRTALVICSAGLVLGWSCLRHFQLPMGHSRLPWGGIVFGHRGCRKITGIPENTLDAFKYALSRGCGGIECDVRLTKDNEVVVFHDAFVNGMLRGFPAERRVDEMTLSELKNCDYVDDPTGQIRVPTLEEAILFCRENNLKMLIEIKELRKPYVCVDQVLDLYRRYGDYMYDQTTLISFHPGILYYARHRDQRVATGAIYNYNTIRSYVNLKVDRLPWIVRLSPSFFDYALLFFQERIMTWLGGCSVVCPHYSFYNDAYRRQWHTKRIALYLWGFPNSSACTSVMKQPAVFVSADAKHEDFMTTKPRADMDLFGDRQRTRERDEAEQRRLGLRD